MSVIGIGTDIVKVSRIQKSLKKFGENFSERILHKNELQVFKQRKTSTHYLAKRFAAKEALAKALGTGIAKGISFEEIEVINNDDGKPELILHGKALEIADQLGVESIFISLSDEKKYAIAYVIVEGK
ncbi:MAG: holo-ACP synthase [Cocleimonas sp.]